MVLYDIWIVKFKILSPQYFTYFRVLELSFIDLYSPCFPRVLIYMISKSWTSGSFHHSSLPTLEVLEISFNDLCSPCFPRVWIYMISELWNSRYFHHSSLPTLEVLNLSFMELCSLSFPRVLIYMIYIYEFWTSWSFDHSS